MYACYHTREHLGLDWSHCGGKPSASRDMLQYLHQEQSAVPWVAFMVHGPGQTTSWHLGADFGNQ